jgi:AAA domain
VYTDRDDREARIELLIRGGEFVSGGVNANGAAWEWPDGMPALGELPTVTTEDVLELEQEINAAVIANGGKLGAARSKKEQPARREKREPKRREDCRTDEWINQEALGRLGDWVPDLFPGARRSGKTYRVGPDDLCRDCEEDLSFHPDGIMDFGAEQPHDAISVVQKFFIVDADGELSPAEYGDDYAPLGTLPRERAIAELCKLLNIDLRAERARDWDLTQANFDDGFIEAHPEHAVAAQAAVEGDEAVKSKQPSILMLDALGQVGEASDFVEGTLCDGQISAWSGEPNAGKTFVALDLGMRVALGWRWHGREVDRGGVIFIAGEGAGGIKQRIAAFRQHHGMDKTADAWFAVVPVAVNFRDKASVGGLIAAINGAAPMLGGRVRLIVVDTLSRALAGGDENSSVDMGALVAAADRVRLATGAHVMLIHHTGKDPSKGARGHSLLRGNIDTELLVERGDAPGTIIARTTKQRDLECTGIFSFQLRQKELGTNRRGKQITSCVVKTADMPRPKLSEKSSTCFQILNELLPEDVSEADEASHLMVKIDVWRDAVMRRLEEGGVASASTRRNDFRRAKGALLSSGHIMISGDQVGMPW